MVQPLYLKDTYLFELNSIVQEYSLDEKGHYVLLDQTIFYPQGGGQPCDLGLLQGDNFVLQIIAVRQIEKEIRHYLASKPALDPQNQSVCCLIDQNRRLLNARYHTAAHLVSNIIETLYPPLKAVKAHAFPQEAYLELQGSMIIDPVELQQAINTAIATGQETQVFETTVEHFTEQFYQLPYLIPSNKAFRVMQIAGYLPIPCGGTHLTNTNEIGQINLTKTKAKNNLLRISYEIL